LDVIADIKDWIIKKDRGIVPSRSLNVLKKNKKGLLTEYQRSFFSGRNLLQRADAVLPEKT